MFISNHWDVIIECAGGFVHFLLVLLEADIGFQLPVGTDEGGLHREGEGIRFVAIDAGVAGLWLGCQRERSLCVRSGCGDQLLVGHVKREHSTLGVTERIVDVVILGDVVGIVVLHVGQFQLGQGGEAVLGAAPLVLARRDVQCGPVGDGVAVVGERCCDVRRGFNLNGVLRRCAVVLVGIGIQGREVNLHRHRARLAADGHVAIALLHGGPCRGVLPGDRLRDISLFVS